MKCRNGTNEGGWGSLNHFMMGYGDTWLHRLSGLAQQPRSVTWHKIDYAPIVIGDITSASSSYRTISGVAKAGWALSGNTLTYDVVVPVGSFGYVTLKSKDIQESGQVLKAGENGILNIKDNGNSTTIEVGSGTYKFQAVL
jgi:hypothetical protein